MTRLRPLARSQSLTSQPSCGLRKAAVASRRPSGLNAIATTSLTWPSRWSGSGSPPAARSQTTTGFDLEGLVQLTRQARARRRPSGLNASRCVFAEDRRQRSVRTSSARVRVDELDHGPRLSSARDLSLGDGQELAIGAESQLPHRVDALVGELPQQPARG